MSWNILSGNNEANQRYTTGGYSKMKVRKLLLIAAAVLAVVALTVHFSQPESQQSKYLKSAMAAARKQIPNATVSQVKVSGGFALATVSNPATKGNADVTSVSVFKVNKDGSMTLLATNGYFSPVDLLEFGIPLATQAKLTGINLAQVQQTLASTCSYSGNNTPGYLGFDGSFNPDAWQIDSATLRDLEQAVSDTVSNTNATAAADRVVVCIKATQKNSNATTDTTTYISTFTLQVQFFTADGALTTHTLTFAAGPNYYRNYTLDGNDIQ